MKALNLAIYTGTENTHKVTMTAEFDNHEDAVAFHEGVARLCKDSSIPNRDSALARHTMKLLGRG